jgi:hypothetical protein
MNDDLSWGRWSPAAVKAHYAIVDALAVARLARLVTADTILDGPRDWWLRRHPLEGQPALDADLPVGSLDSRTRADGHLVDRQGRALWWDADDDGALGWRYVESDKLGELIVCPWCMGMWLAVGVVALRSSRLARLWDPLARVLAMSEVAGQLRAHENDE